MVSGPPPSRPVMRATLGELPADDAGWAYEVKWDGIRAVVTVTGATVTIRSSNDRDITDRWPELAPLAAELAGHDAVLDGEIVTFDDAGRPDFGLLAKRMHVGTRRAAAEWAATQPAVFIAFDLLWLDGHDTTGLAYHDRRQLLETLLDAGPNWQVPAYREGDGRALFAAVRDQGLEGLMAKRLDSRYEAGRRSPAWRKIKARRQQELVVGGWSPGRGGRADGVGALAVGYHDATGRLRFAGKVGSGLDDDELRWWRRRVDELAAAVCPFDPPPPPAFARELSWLRPEVVVEVAFAEWSADGHLRHPSYLGVRDDKDPATVVRE